MTDLSPLEADFVNDSVPCNLNDPKMCDAFVWSESVAWAQWVSSGGAIPEQYLIPWLATVPGELQ